LISSAQNIKFLRLLVQYIESGYASQVEEMNLFNASPKDEFAVSYSIL